MRRKDMDMIVANDVSDPSLGFNSDDNAVTVLWRDGEQALERARKSVIAQKIVLLIAEQTRRSD
jgi:phosphopantothenoylcysteine decarboxylase/phosphopantothenate--cysteine ligase